MYCLETILAVLIHWIQEISVLTNILSYLNNINMSFQ